MFVWLRKKIETYFFPEVANCGVCETSPKVRIVQTSSGDHIIKITCSSSQEHLSISQLSKTHTKKTERGMELSLKFAFRKAAHSWNTQSKNLRSQ